MGTTVEIETRNTVEKCAQGRYRHYLCPSHVQSSEDDLFERRRELRSAICVDRTKRQKRCAEITRRESCFPLSYIYAKKGDELMISTKASTRYKNTRVFSKIHALAADLKRATRSPIPAFSSNFVCVIKLRHFVSMAVPTP